MPFTVAEKATLLFYLGYSGYEDDGPATRSINSLDAQEARMGPILRETLDFLKVVDREIRETLPLAAAIEDGSVKIRAHYTLAHLRSVGRQYVKRLASWTKIAVGEDIFSSGSPRKDFYSGDPSEQRVDNSSGVPQWDT